MADLEKVVSAATADGQLLAEASAPPPDGSMAGKKILVGITYMLAMGVCGVILVALGSTLEGLAADVGLTATKIGTVFIARGIGAVLGALLSAKLYKWFLGNRVLFAALLALTVLLFILPFTKSLVFLHVEFLLLGLGTAITDTGCQILTRKIHGKRAGPWLGANTVAFGIAGALVPLIQVFTYSLVIQYTILGSLVAIVCAMTALIPDGESFMAPGGGPPGMKRPGPNDGRGIPHFNVEIVISIMVFFFIGGKVTMTAYLITYVNTKGILDSQQASLLVLVLWLAITVGRLSGVQDQMYVTNKTLPNHLGLFCMGGALAMSLILMFPDSADCLWIGIAFYGLFNGPCVGYCYDWNNRSTYPTEKSMAIVMFGLNFGASLVPYATALIWEHGAGPSTLMVVTFLSMCLPIPLLFSTLYLSYDPTINPRMKHHYATIPQDEPI